MRALIMPSRRSPRPVRRSVRQHAGGGRRGFTIIEMLISLMLLTAGVLAVASSSAVMIRQMTDGNRQAIAASAAADRLERFRTFNTCASIVAGTGNAYGMTEKWGVADVVGLGGQASKTITYELTYRGARGNRKLTFVTTVPCTN